MASLLGFCATMCLVLSVGVLALGLWDRNFQVQPLPGWLVLMCFGVAGALVYTVVHALERRTRTLEQARLEARLHQLESRGAKD